MDTDRYRFRHGESPSQKLLMQSDPKLFSWAVDGQMGSVIQNQGDSLPSRLQKLDLRLSTVINVLKVVFAAYAQSLKEIDLFMRMTAATCSTSEPLIFDDWNLPWVRAIDISFPPRSLVCVGDFSDCPVLEILSLVPSSYPGFSRFSNDVHRVAPRLETVAYQIVAPCWSSRAAVQF